MYLNKKQEKALSAALGALDYFTGYMGNQYEEDMDIIAQMLIKSREEKTKCRVKAKNKKQKKKVN